MNFQDAMYALPGILLGLTVHECCHALCAWTLGDGTAREQGRITLNPLKHIDPFGLLFIILAGFGWAKPVQYDPSRLKNLRRDKALIAAAGPLSNFLLGLIFITIVKAILPYYSNPDVEVSVLAHVTFLVLFRAAVINFGLFIFNLIPIPPLDGSHIVFSGLNINPEIEKKIMRFGMPVLFLILLIQNYAKITILPIGNIVRALVNFFLHA